MGECHLANQAVRLLWQLWPGAIDDDTVASIISLAEAQASQDATTFGASSPDIRSSKVRWIQDVGLRNTLFEFVTMANTNAFGVDVYNHTDMQFTEYHATESGHYDWHHDINWEAEINADRKLSITVQLSDPSEYSGGDFEFSECETPRCKDKGSVLVFPSYLRHRVTPVTSGVRRSLVAWFYGPCWR